MPKIGFNKTEITKLVLPVQKKLQAGEQKYFWDKYNPGIGLKVTPSKIVYIVQARGKDGKDKPRQMEKMKPKTKTKQSERPKPVFIW